MPNRASVDNDQLSGSAEVQEPAEWCAKLFPCPLCPQSWSADEIEAHVHQCLERLGTPHVPSDETQPSRQALRAEEAPVEVEGSEVTLTVSEEEEFVVAVEQEHDEVVLVMGEQIKAGSPSSPPPLSAMGAAAKAKAAWASIFTKGKGKAAHPPAASTSSRVEEEGEAAEKAAPTWPGLREGRKPRACPFYKILPDMGIAVDAFLYGRVPRVRAYLLSHFHSDHYGGLTRKWNHGLIYCSSITANLVERQLGVDPRWVRRLPMHETTVMDAEEVDGVLWPAVHISLLDANHCPGAVLFLLEGTPLGPVGATPVRYLHTGDFRALPSMPGHPLLQGSVLDLLYLDTTYLDPAYCFPSQHEVITALCTVAKRMIVRQETLDAAIQGYPYAEVCSGQEPSPRKRPPTLLGWLTSAATASSSSTITTKPRSRRVLFVVGSYSIGKERVWTALARCLGSKVYVEAGRRRLLECQEDVELVALLTRRAAEANIHIVPMSHLSAEKLKAHLERMRGTHDFLLAVRPTGWTHSAPTSSSSPSNADARAAPFTPASLTPRYITPHIALVGLPYSEHSSFAELRGFVSALRCRRVIPTVNVGSAKRREAMDQWIRLWSGGRL